MTAARAWASEASVAGDGATPTLGPLPSARLLGTGSSSHCRRFPPPVRFLVVISAQKVSQLLGNKYSPRPRFLPRPLAPAAEWMPGKDSPCQPRAVWLLLEAGQGCCQGLSSCWEAALRDVADPGGRLPHPQARGLRCAVRDTHTGASELGTAQDPAWCRNGVTRALPGRWD